MSEEAQRIKSFVSYARSLSGYEKGEAQVFCDRLFQAFGHAGYKEAGAELEPPVKRKGNARGFADLIWKPRLLLEMKSRGESLQKHYQQVFEYWLHATPNRPRFVVLCNFDEFWIYDFNIQLHEPVDRLHIKDLADAYDALNFLFPFERKPIFANNRVDVTRKAADKVAQVFNALVQRAEDRVRAQRFVLQCVVAMFSEDFDLLPKGLFSELLDDCIAGQSTYDIIGSLFLQMNSPRPARAGRFSKVKYFNGGLFNNIDPVELNGDELKLLRDAAGERWSKVAPPIFGTLFQQSMDKERRHALGAHFTSEADIQKVVFPTIVKPWRERIARADTLRDLKQLADELLHVRVLDPACGSGNFLYVAYRELIGLEMEILYKIHENFADRARKAVGIASLLASKQFYGIDIDEFGVELAKVTVMLGKRLALAETRDSWFSKTGELPFDFDEPLPLDNLDANIVRDDALFCSWPKVDYIIGNPPYQSKNKMQEEFGRAYLNRLRERYPKVPGRADYCVYWFRRAHDELPHNGRAGLVGTNTVRQNYSREGGLDYIVTNGGQIHDAVSTQVWSGDASVHVSIVNWVKGNYDGQRKLMTQLGDSVDSPWRAETLKHIPPTLSSEVDLSKAPRLRTNIESKTCHQGQTHGRDGFVLDLLEASHYISEDPQNRDVLFPYLNTDELLTTFPPCPQHFVIDFGRREVTEAAKFKIPFRRVKKLVLPPREEAAAKEKKRNEEARATNPRARVNCHHERFLNKWWLLSYPRHGLMRQLSHIPRFIACGQLTKRPIFEFISSSIHPNAQLIVFPFSDDYSFGVLQSSIHWRWFLAKGSTQTTRPRYTSDTVFDTFPWPQSPSLRQAAAVAKAAVALRKKRCEIMEKNRWSFRELYRTLDDPGDHPLRRAQIELDTAVYQCYGVSSDSDPLRELSELGQALAERESREQQVISPGLPPAVSDPTSFITTDCVQPPLNWR